MLYVTQRFKLAPSEIMTVQTVWHYHSFANSQKMSQVEPLQEGKTSGVVLDDHA